MLQKYLSFLSTLLVSAFCPIFCLGQDKNPIPIASKLEQQTKEIRSQEWFPKPNSSRLQNVAAAITLSERAISENSLEVRYAILNEALRFSNKAREWSLSREILGQIDEQFENEPLWLSDWYATAIRQKQSQARISELVNLFSKDVANKNELPGPVKLWKSNERQLLRKIQKSKNDSLSRWCLPKLAETANLLELRSAEDRPLWQGVSAIVRRNEIEAGAKLLATCRKQKVKDAATILVADFENSEAFTELISVLATDGDPNLQRAAERIFQSRLDQLSLKEIAQAQNACYLEARQGLSPDFLIMFAGPDGNSFIDPSNIGDSQNIFYDESNKAWVAHDKFTVGYPKIPLVNFVHDIELTFHTLGSGFRFKYGTHFNTRLYFEHNDHDKIKFTHRSAAGNRSNWKGTRSFNQAQKLRFTVYSICGEQFIVADGRLMSRRGSPVQWLKCELRSFGQSHVELTKSTIRRWLPGDERMFELVVNSSDILKCTISPAIDFQSSDLKLLFKDCDKLNKRPDGKSAFVNDVEIVMQPIASGNFQRGKTKVKISQNFWVSRHEISQLQWEQLMEQNPASIQGNPDFPVDNVSYQQVAEFCRLLTAKEKKSRRLLSGYVYRLPTENEWEFVARAGSSEDFSVDKEGFWHRATAASRYHAVGSSKPNDWSVFDMHGNVDEFVLDRYRKPAEKPAPVETDPIAIPSDGVRVVCRGGSWYSPVEQCTSKIRREQTMEAAPYRGFRVVLAPVIKGS